MNKIIKLYLTEEEEAMMKRGMKKLKITSPSSYIEYLVKLDKKRRSYEENYKKDKLAKASKQ
ncbi:MAG: hypothetical protein WC386_00150 [Candidatus Paceibacterota bacterium]|jgi:hypothetical protein